MNENELIKKVTDLVMKELQKTNNDNIINQENINNKKSINKREVVIGVSPTFNEEVKNTLSGLTHKEIIKEIVAGIEEEGLSVRILKVYKTADVAFIGKEAAILSGSGIGIGLQSKGTTIIHQRDLYPLSNLELFSQAPLIDLKTYRSIGKNAAKYAKLENPIPIKIKNDCMIRPKYQVKAALFHIKDAEKVVRGEKSIEIPLEDFI